jgi:hypothetical protein
MGMELESLTCLFRDAKNRTGHSEFVVVGSLSILGVLRDQDIPQHMLMSRDVDCYTLHDPDRIFDLQTDLGEGSPFDLSHGYFMDPVSPHLPTLPDDWQQRLIPLELADGIRVWFLEPNDAAVSKYARGDPRDREWLRAGLSAGLLSIPVIESRFSQTLFLDASEALRAGKMLAEDAAWVDG